MSTTDKFALSPSIHEATIKRYLRKDEDDDVLEQLFDAVKLTREACTKARDLTASVLANDMATPAANHKQARTAGFEALERATKAIDTATNNCMEEIKAIKVKLRGPPPSKDALQEARQRELRERLSQLPSNRRHQIIDHAIATDDALVISAVLNAAGWLSDLTDAEQNMIRANWAQQRFPAEIERMGRLEAALTDAMRVGTLAIAFVDQLTDAKLVADATGKEKAAAAALAAAKAV